MSPLSRHRRRRSCGGGEPERPEQECFELHLPTARAGRLQEAVTVVPVGLWAGALSLERGRLPRVLFDAVSHSQRTGQLLSPAAELGWRCR